MSSGSSASHIAPARLSRVRDSFDHAGWIYEIEHDGFRGLAYIDNGTAWLVRKNGTPSSPSPGSVTASPPVFPAAVILDGEIVCLGPDGRALFDPLL